MIKSSKPTCSAPASFAACAAAPSRENEHAHLLAAAVRERAGAAHHLVGLLRINPEPERHRHRLVELGRRQFLQRRNSVGETVGLVAIHLLGGRAITFAAIFLHDDFSSSEPAWRDSPDLVPPSGESGSEGLAK